MQPYVKLFRFLSPPNELVNRLKKCFHLLRTIRQLSTSSSAFWHTTKIHRDHFQKCKSLVMPTCKLMKHLLLFACLIVLLDLYFKIIIVFSTNNMCTRIDTILDTVSRLGPAVDELTEIVQRMSCQSLRCVIKKPKKYDFCAPVLKCNDTDYYYDN